MDKLILTGAGGFIGRHVLSVLAETDWEVHAVDRRQPAGLSHLATWHELDLLDSGQVARLMEQIRPSHLLHLAWYTEPGKYWTSLENFRWVRATLGLLAGFRNGGGRRVVTAGSCAEYDWSHGTCREVSTPLVPATTYGQCKNHLRGLTESFCAQARMSGAWGRVFLLYGPHEHPDRLVPSVIRALVEDRPARCTHGEQVRDFLYVEDVARAFVALIESEVTGAVNIGSGEPVAIRDVVGRIADKLDGRERVEFGALQANPAEPDVLLAGIERLANEVRWKPAYDLDQGLDKTIEHWKSRLAAGEPCD